MMPISNGKHRPNRREKLYRNHSRTYIEQDGGDQPYDIYNRGSGISRKRSLVLFLQYENTSSKYLYRVSVTDARVLISVARLRVRTVIIISRYSSEGLITKAVPFGGSVLNRQRYSKGMPLGVVSIPFIHRV